MFRHESAARRKAGVLEYVQLNQVFHSGHTGGLLGQRGIKGLALTFRPSRLHSLKTLLAI